MDDEQIGIYIAFIIAIIVLLSFSIAHQVQLENIKEEIHLENAETDEFVEESSKLLVQLANITIHLANNGHFNNVPSFKDGWTMKTCAYPYSCYTNMTIQEYETLRNKSTCMYMVMCGQIEGYK